MILALLKNNIVTQVIIANELIDFPEFQVINVTDHPQRPSLGDSYYPETNTFVSNCRGLNPIEIDLTQPHLNQGTEDTIDPIYLSEFTATYENGLIIIGCRSYPAIGLYDALYKVFNQNEKTIGFFTVEGGNPRHGKFEISWDDAERLYNALSRLRFT